MMRTDYTGRDPIGLDQSYVIKATQSQALNDGGVICLRFPADPERFTDLNTVLLRLEVSVQKPNGEEPGEDDPPVTIDEQGMHALFQTVTVRFNERAISVMNAYPYTAKLCRMLGMSAGLRTGVFDTLDASRAPSLKASQIADNAATRLATTATAHRILKNAVLYGRVYADILTSARQYLPPGIALGVDLRRAPDQFTLQSPDANAKYRLFVSNASLYVKRRRMEPSPTIASQIASGGTLGYNRLETRLVSIPKETKVFNWLNCLGTGAQLPNRLYLTFIAQKSFYGTINQASTWFEHMYLHRLSVKVGGRDILVEPITSTFISTAAGQLDTTKTEALDGFLSVAEVVDAIRDQTAPLRLNYADYLLGGVVYAIEFGKCGERTGAYSGAVDIEAEFSRVDEAAQTNSGTPEPCLMVAFCERTEYVNLAAAAS